MRAYMDGCKLTVNYFSGAMRRRRIPKFQQPESKLENICNDPNLWRSEKLLRSCDVQPVGETCCERGLSSVLTMAPTPQSHNKES